MKSKWLDVKYTSACAYRSTEPSRNLTRPPTGPSRFEAPPRGREPSGVSATQDEQRSGRDPAGTALERLVDRFDPSVFDVGRPLVRIRVEDGESHDVVLEDGRAKLEPPRGTPDAVLSADAKTWSDIAEDLRGGM